MENWNTAEGPARIVRRTFVSRTAVEAFFKYCRVATRLQQDPEDAPAGGKRAKRLLH